MVRVRFVVAPRCSEILYLSCHTGHCSSLFLFNDIALPLTVLKITIACVETILF